MDIRLLATQLELFHAIFDKSCDAIVIVDAEFRVRYWSKSAERLFGNNADAIDGKDLIELITPMRNRNTIRKAFVDYQERGDSSLFSRVHEVTVLRSDGNEIWVDISLTDIRIEEQKWLLAIIRDAESRKQRELILQHAAATDSLSGLANRSEFQIRLEANLSSGVALAIIDLDQFKLVNDEHGHPVGDEAIKHAATILQEFFEGAICIARLGGDEFGVIVGSTSEQEMQSCFGRFIQKLEQTEFSDLGLTLTASVGVAISSENSTARSLLTTADKCMYQSKRAGRNRVCVATDPSTR